MGIITISTVVTANEVELTEVIHPPVQSGLDARDTDFIEILRTALEKTVDTDGPFLLRATTLEMNPSRFRYQIFSTRDLV